MIKWSFFFFLWIESNRMQIELCFVNRTNSELNANRFSSCDSNQMRIDFSNQINSESNANRVFFFVNRTNAAPNDRFLNARLFTLLTIVILLKNRFFFVCFKWIESLPNQIKFNANRLSFSKSNQFRIKCESIFFQLLDSSNYWQLCFYKKI